MRAWEPLLGRGLGGRVKPASSQESSTLLRAACAFYFIGWFREGRWRETVKSVWQKVPSPGRGSCSFSHTSILLSVLELAWIFSFRLSVRPRGKLCCSSGWSSPVGATQVLMLAGVGKYSQPGCCIAGTGSPSGEHMLLIRNPSGEAFPLTQCQCYEGLFPVSPRNQQDLILVPPSSLPH